MKLWFRIAALAFILAFSCFYISYFFDGYLGLSDGNDYAGLARNIVRGEGFTLGHVYPLAMTFDPDVPQPNNMWAPAYPVYLAFWLLLLGTSDFALMIATIAVVWFLILLAYNAGSRLLNPSWGLLAAALVGLNQSVLKTALDGSPEILTAALLLLSVLILSKRIKGGVVLSGVIFGIAILSRYQIALLAVPAILYFLNKDKKSAFLWSGIILATVSPWLIRNMMVFGNPVFTLQTYGEFTKGMGHLDYYYYTYRSFTPMTFWYALGNFPFYLFKKFIAGNVYFALNFPAIVNFFGIIPLAYFARRLFNQEDAEIAFFKFTAVSLVILVGVSSLDGQHWRHVVNLHPFLAVSIALGLKSIIIGVPAFKRITLSIALILLIFFPARLPFQELELSHTSNTVRASLPVYELINSESEPGDVVISDASDAVWWYADRPSVWIPVLYPDVVRALEISDAEYVYLEDLSAFLTSLSNEEIIDFYSRVYPIHGEPASWTLFKRNRE
ncbi:MAG: glycosyltransferase family 39 protein [candidate division Zixibacteria bacterium]